MKREAVWSLLKTQSCHSEGGSSPTWDTPVKYSLGQVYEALRTTSRAAQTGTSFFQSLAREPPIWWSQALNLKISSFVFTP